MKDVFRGVANTRIKFITIFCSAMLAYIIFEKNQSGRIFETWLMGPDVYLHGGGVVVTELGWVVR
jgi:hypothetical protein